MSQERFIRCPHCSLPHEADLAECPVTKKSLAVKPRKPARSATPAGERSYAWEHSLDGAPLRNDGDLDPERLEAFVGAVIEKKYRVDALIGWGGMGAVYRAENLRIKKQVALKVLYSLGPDSENERRFLREARIAGSIGHPNIVEVFDLGHLDDGKPFQVMELLEGQTLAERIRAEGAIAEDEALTIGMQVLSALAAAHDKAIVHRDLKPENVFLVEREGRLVAKLLDFGVSKALHEHSLAITMTGAVVGTPYYLSPEQARGERIDHKVDLWAMGVLLYETLTGVLPFNAKGYEELLTKIIRGRPTPPSKFQPRITPAVEAVILRALSNDPARRFESALDMKDQLSTARRSRRFPAYELDGAGDQTVRQAPPTIEEVTEVSDSFFVKKGRGES
jgi:serine/threonine protein kinase